MLKKLSQPIKDLKHYIIMTMKKYVITGAPGCGKTSMINYLEVRLSEYVVREAARDYIELRQAEGCKEPWLDDDFQQGITQLTLLRRSRMPNVDRIFCDREVMDGLAYTDNGYRDFLKKNAIEVEKVFFLEQLNHTDTNSYRREDHDLARLVGERLQKEYKDLGYDVIKIPMKDSLKQRVEYLMRWVE